MSPCTSRFSLKLNVYYNIETVLISEQDDNNFRKPRLNNTCKHYKEKTKQNRCLILFQSLHVIQSKHRIDFEMQDLEAGSIKFLSLSF